jgi:predicted glycosyltransferase
MAHAFRMPAGLDYVKLPSVTRLPTDEYSASTLNVPFDEVARLREELLFQTTRLFRPDILFVDTPPLSPTGEIGRTLRHVRESMPGTAVVLNLRDILDDGDRVIEQWRKHGVSRILEQMVDRILIYGTREVYDAGAEYQFSHSLLEKTAYCGYIGRTHDADAAAEIRQRFCPGGEKLIVVTAGGGSDGASLITRYMTAATNGERLGGAASVVIFGPDFPPEARLKICDEHGASRNVCLMDFAEPATAYIAAADLVVSMAGYNTVSEIVYLGKRAILVPRVAYSREQLLRARRFADLGLVRMLHPDEAAPERIAESVHGALRDVPPQRGSAVDFGGSTAFVREVKSLMSSRRVGAA